ncbi:MAG: glycosyltransferase family 4 protein, partial [Deltaproteobacteria bacterium]|nr:glycosyltransferase family 4 protein [Deltaproteobacteria bacterium]
VFYLTRELLARGIKVKVLVRQQKPGMIRYQGVRAEAVSFPGFPPLNNGAFRRYIVAKATTWGADLIHIHASSMPAPDSGRPLVVTSHCCIGAITPLFYRPLLDGESLYRNLLLPLYTRIEKKLATSCDKLTVVSQSMADDFQHLHGVSAEVVWNGVDVDRFHPDSSPAGSARVVFVGALKRGKGVLDLLEAARRLNGHNSRLQFDLYGEGPLRHTLEKRKVRHGLANFRMPGSVTHDALPGVLATATVVILPSYYEGLPNTLLEAMACGIPVIATAVKGNSEIVIDGVTGYLTPPHNPPALAEAISRILAAPDKARNMGLKGRRLVEEKFTWAQRAEQFINIYERTLSE